MLNVYGLIQKNICLLCQDTRDLLNRARILSVQRLNFILYRLRNSQYDK